MMMLETANPLALIQLVNQFKMLSVMSVDLRIIQTKSTQMISVSKLI